MRTKSESGLHLCLLLILPMLSIHAAAAEREEDTWSAPTNGLQARLVLTEKPKDAGVRWLVPYLELRNVRELNSPLQVNCDNRHLQVEALTSDGHHVPVMGTRRSGAVPEIGTIVLPRDSFIRISLECRNWGQRQATAIVATDSGTWGFQATDKGKVFLRATLKVNPEGSFPTPRIWSGQIQTPLLKVDWK